MKKSKRPAGDIRYSAPETLPGQTDLEQWLQDRNGDRCCPEDYGGSHYHCANCGEVSSMFGHTSQRPVDIGHGTTVYFTCESREGWQEELAKVCQASMGFVPTWLVKDTLRQT